MKGINKKSVMDSLSAMTMVLKNPTYLAIAVFVTALVLFLAIWLPNISFLKHTVTNDLYSAGDKFMILWTSIGNIKTNFTPLSRLLTVSVALLTGLNVSLLVYYLRHRFKLEKTAGTSLIGTLVGLLGVGCTACGSVIIASIFGVGATATFVGLFPLGGAEFGILGVLILLFANYSLALKTHVPLTCEI